MEEDLRREEGEEREREIVREGREEEGGRGRRERRKLRAALKRAVSVWTSHEPCASGETTMENGRFALPFVQPPLELSEFPQWMPQM